MIFIKTITRSPGKKPYPSTVWLEKPVKTALILLGIGAGILWLVNGRLENPPFLPIVTTTSAAVCVGALGAYCVYATLSTHREERFARACRDARKERLEELEGQGFSPTRRFIGSSRMLLVDEGMGTWCLFDYFNSPGQAQLHKLSDIVSVRVGENREWVPPSYKVLLSTGRRLNRKDNEEYYTKKGVLLILNEKDCPYVFINCFKTENDVEIITDYFCSLLEHREGYHDGQ